MSKKISMLSMSLVLLMLTNCGTVNKPPSKNDYLEIRNGAKSLVLLRVTCKLPDGSSVEPFQYFSGGDNVNFWLGNFDTGGSLEIPVVQRFLSPHVRKNGWVYTLLEPGIYYIGFQGGIRTDQITYYKQFKEVPKYRFEIESNTQVAYIGTMHLQCKSAWFLTGQKACNWIYGQDVKKEEALAQELVSTNLPALDGPKTALMQLHTGKTIYLRTPESKK